ncbi:MAG: hypothetical protein AB8B66_03205 [Rickettsiaceae bacterium]
MDDGSIQMNSAGIRESFNKDINRSSLFYIETDQGITDLVQEIKLQYGQSHVVNYDNMHDLLCDKYKLSPEQTEYILATSYQGSISGGMTGFGSLLLQVNDDPETCMNRNGNVSKIVIDKNNNLSYVGGQKITFDCHHEAYDGIIRDTVHTNFKSENYMAATISTKLGQLGAVNLDPQIVIDVVGKGVNGTNIINQLETIETTVPPISAQEALDKYHDFSNSMMELSGQNKLYQQAIKTEIDKVLSLNPSEINKIEVQNLKQLNFTQETLAESLLNKVDKQLNALKEKGKHITNSDKQNIANNMTMGLEKFVDLPKGYIERFSKDLVNQRAEAKEPNSSKKNFIQKIVSYVKDAWHGYDKGQTKDIILAQVQSQAKKIGLNINKRKQEAKTMPEQPSAKRQRSAAVHKR